MVVVDAVRVEEPDRGAVEYDECDVMLARFDKRGRLCCAARGVDETGR